MTKVQKYKQMCYKRDYFKENESNDQDAWIRYEKWASRAAMNKPSSKDYKDHTFYMLQHKEQE